MHWQIILGMVGGVLFALAMVQFDWGPKIVSDWMKPFGNIFINSLKLIAVPLILASLIKGVSDLKDISKLSKMGGRTIGIYHYNYCYCRFHWTYHGKYYKTRCLYFRRNDVTNWWRIIKVMPIPK